jgi:hypothetical protein
MSTYTCSKNNTHQSTDSDYCSICGAKMAGTPSSLTTPQVAVSSTSQLALELNLGSQTQQANAQICPDCGTPRPNATARFCEVCRYNFSASATNVSSQKPMSIPVSMPIAPAITPPVIPVPVISSVSKNALLSTTAYSKWEVLVVVDPSLYEEPDPELPCPVNEPERYFHLDFAENLIGRPSRKKEIFPEIPIDDPGLSHRHAKLLRQDDGSFILLDLGSTNGTQLNGKEVQAGVKTPIKEGDQITLGCWTRMTLRRLA